LAAGVRKLAEAHNREIRRQFQRRKYSWLQIHRRNIVNDAQGTPASGYGEATSILHRTAGGDRPELLDAVVADADVPVVKVDGRVAVARDQADLVAETEPVGGGR
jgi:hypothetical protein